MNRRRFLATLAAAVAAPFAVRKAEREWIGPGRNVPGTLQLQYGKYDHVDREVSTMYAAPRGSGPGDGACSQGAARIIREFYQVDSWLVSQPPV